MKFSLMLLLVVFIYALNVYAEVGEDFCSDYGHSRQRLDCYYQLLLKRWYDGADGQEQAPVDSAVRRRILKHLTVVSDYASLEQLKNIVNLGRYRGLGIFKYEGKYQENCMPNTVYHPHRVDGIAVKMVKEHYNINVDVKTICRGIWNHVMPKSHDVLIGVSGLPDDEAIIFLVSGITGEVLSTYKYKVRKEYKK